MSFATQLTLAFQAVAAEVKKKIAFPTGGSTGDVLTKTGASSAGWSTPSSGGGSTNPTITYTGSAWPARTTVTVPSGGYVIYDSLGYPSAPMPSDYVDGDVWYQSGVLPATLGARQMSAWHATAGGTAVSGLGATLVATGTATAATVAPSGTAQTKRPRLEFLATTAATTAIGGVRDTGVMPTTGAGFKASFVFGPATGVTDSTRRCFVGLGSATGAPTDVAIPGTLADILGVGYDSADTNFQFYNRTGTGTAVKTDTGIARPTADRTGAYQLDILMVAGATTATLTLTDLATGTAFTLTTSTAIPAATTGLMFRAWCSAGGTSSVMGLALMSRVIEAAV